MFLALKAPMEGATGQTSGLTAAPELRTQQGVIR